MFEGVQKASLHCLLHADRLTCQTGKTAPEVLLKHTRPTSPLTQQAVWQRSAQICAQQPEHMAGSRYKKSDWEHAWRIYGAPLSPGRVFLLFLFSQSSAAKPGNCTSCACLVVCSWLLAPSCQNGFQPSSPGDSAVSVHTSQLGMRNGNCRAIPRRIHLLKQQPEFHSTTGDCRPTALVPAPSPFGNFLMRLRCRFCAANFEARTPPWPSKTAKYETRVL